jgi:hypothetical protein
MLAGTGKEWPAPPQCTIAAHCGHSRGAAHSSSMFCMTDQDSGSLSVALVLWIHLQSTQAHTKVISAAL